MIVLRVALPLPLRQHFDYLLPESESVSPGCRVQVPFGNRELIGIVWQLQPADHYPAEQLKTVLKVLDKAPVLAADLRQLLSFAADYYHHPLGEVLTSALPALLREGKNADPIRTVRYQLTEAGQALDEQQFKRAPKRLALWQLLKTAPEQQALSGQFSRSELNYFLELQYAEAVEVPYGPYTPQPETQKALPLNPAQALAVSRVTQSLGQFATFLLDGVTGSGKTEVYLQSISPVVAAGGQVLVLVPEIGLTPQTLARFEQRFGVPVGVWHSNMTDLERFTVWQRCQTGDLAILIGTRSALFLPFLTLQLLILDEEHDASFKQQDGFRYHARDLAIKRAALLKLPVLLGSATPSLESLANVQAGRFFPLPLPERATGHAVPKVELVDLKQQVMQAGLAGLTRQRIQQNLDKGRQVLLFLNRRGFAPALICHECGWLTECQRCSAFMTYHKQSRQLVCHHCGSIKAVPRQCGGCGSTQLSTVGQGTEQLEEQLQVLFPKVPITRLDRDSTRRKGSLDQALQQIHQGEPQLIVGTQMLAKGHHFPNVALAVIVDVDGALYSSDFRAPEQLAQLLTQVAGRSGRGSEPGTVLLQTHYPGHALLQDVIQNGYASFARSALLERQYTQLPPYMHLALFRTEALQLELCQQWLQQLTQLLGAYPTLQLLGPLACPMERKAGKYRWQLQLFCKDRKVLHQALAQAVATVKDWPLSRKLKWQLDVDPLDLS
ncbi:primosomal protein N' [Rheinheimera sp.]|uniref:primosomal protein N' n=1 Tax=Rheinheimera sp. TaxID=1869214 RepID=UPI00307F93AC